ncbi:MAG: 50S ribosomal protein L25/general stress protein Ctc [Gordonia sp. (in: high G+C Gram-positive bacteria)]|uniref:50S ribosomal protein L25/general stress protein Ctc n=1 Tax=Gordonia sp. (in: high G+C Gram-positive bacteria) TaxID=84139 RepID=UPI003BB6A55D
MSTQTPKLQTTDRTDTGKGAARRARRDGLVPAVLYGHGADPKHLLLPKLELAAILRANGTNAIIDLELGGQSQLALTKQVDVHPIRNYIEHLDLLIVKRGEKVTVEVPLLIEGEPAPGGLLIQDANSLLIEAEALHIPENIVVSAEGLAAGTNVVAGDLELPKGATLVSADDTLVISISEAKSTESDSDDAAAASAEEAAE